MRTEKQLAAIAWFYDLRDGARASEPERRASALEQIDGIQGELTRDEYLVLCEEANSCGRTAERTGQSRDRVRALHAAAVRKLVIYRHMQGIGGGCRAP